MWNKSGCLDLGSLSSFPLAGVRWKRKVGTLSGFHDGPSNYTTVEYLAKDYHTVYPEFVLLLPFSCKIRSYLNEVGSPRSI